MALLELCWWRPALQSLAGKINYEESIPAMFADISCKKTQKINSPEEEKFSIMFHEQRVLRSVSTGYLGVAGLSHYTPENEGVLPLCSRNHFSMSQVELPLT